VGSSSVLTLALAPLSSNSCTISCLPHRTANCSADYPTKSISSMMPFTLPASSFSTSFTRPTSTWLNNSLRSSAMDMTAAADVRSGADILQTAEKNNAEVMVQPPARCGGSSGQGGRRSVLPSVWACVRQAACRGARPSPGGSSCRCQIPTTQLAPLAHHTHSATAHTTHSALKSTPPRVSAGGARALVRQRGGRSPEGKQCRFCRRANPLLVWLPALDLDRPRRPFACLQRFFSQN